jgi:hypothetical protein
VRLHVSSVALISPSMAQVAIGFCIAVSVPVQRRFGAKPNGATSAVTFTGRVSR